MAKDGFRINVNTTGFTKKLRELQSIWGLESLTKEAAAVAEQLIAIAVDVTPTDVGELAGSGVVEATPKKGTVRFGFTKVYANFQDGDGRSFQTIKRKRKKALFIPLTEKGRRTHRY